MAVLPSSLQFDSTGDHAEPSPVTMIVGKTSSTGCYRGCAPWMDQTFCPRVVTGQFSARLVDLDGLIVDQAGVPGEVPSYEQLVRDNAGLREATIDTAPAGASAGPPSRRRAARDEHLRLRVNQRPMRADASIDFRNAQHELQRAVSAM
jgi:hypothetical protein